VDRPAGAILVGPGPEAAAELAAAIDSAPRLLLVDRALCLLDEVARWQCVRRFQQLARDGALVLIASHDTDWLERICDLVVAVEQGRVIEQGDPGLTLAHYRGRIADRRRQLDFPGEAAPSSRFGDGRVRLAVLEILGEDGQPVTAVRSGEAVTVRLALSFQETVTEPVAGILIRSRIGVCVYGTNTELEQTPIGARRAGESAEVQFRFRCELCPQEYTLTAASHDPDGTPHDWLEEALLFSVVDSRHTAGVANLRASVRVVG